MKKQLFLIAAISFAVVSRAFPVNIDHLLLPGMTGFVSTLSAGPTWYQAGKTQTLSLQPGLENTYVTGRPSSILASGELFLGFATVISPKLLGQLGLMFATTSHARLLGDVWETADPLLDNYNYTYDVRDVRVGLKGKFLSVMLHDFVLPYGSAGIGVGYNKAYNYSITPKLFEAVPPPAFGPHSNTTVVYSLGTGIHLILSPQIQVVIGYEFCDLGKSLLQAAPGQLQGNGLLIEHFYTHALQLGLSYLAKEF